MSSTAVTVLLVDDHAVVRDGLRGVLDGAGITVVGEASDGLEAVRQVEATHPQVVLMDISMPCLNGLEAARQIKAGPSSAAVVFLTMHESEQYFLEALRCGAEGYVPKSAPAADVVDAVRSAAEGRVYIHPSVGRFLLQSFLRGSQREPNDADPYRSLTAREREVLSLVASGLTNGEIGERLFLSPNTVHRHRTSLMQKLGLHDKLELLRFCIKRGLIDPTS
jgi:two-component system, NarL family, response regulator NreC